MRSQNEIKKRDFEWKSLDGILGRDPWMEIQRSLTNF